MLEYGIESLIKSIEGETGINIRIKTNKRESFYAKMIFFLILRKMNPKITLAKMASYVGLDHSSVVYSLKTYKTVKGYPDFKELENAITAIKIQKLSTNNIYCNHITYPNE